MYDGAISTVELARFLNTASIPAGEVAVHGNVHYERAANQNQSVLDSAYVDGQLDSKQLVVNVGQIRAIPRSIHAEFKLQNGNLNVNSAEADLLGGHVSADYELLHIGGNSSSRAHATVRDISLREMDRTAQVEEGKAVKISGRLNGTAEAEWTSRIQNGLAKASLDIRNPNTVLSEGTIPLNGRIDVAYDGARDTAFFGQSFLQTGNTKISISGILSNHSRLSVQASSADLHEVAALVPLFQSANSTRPTSTENSFLEMGGSAHFSGEVSGAIQQPRIKGDVSVSDLQVKNCEVANVPCHDRCGSSGITFQNGSLVDMQNGQVTFSGHTDLSAWSFTPASPLYAAGQCAANFDFRVAELFSLAISGDGNCGGEYFHSRYGGESAGTGIVAYHEGNPHGTNLFRI